MSQGYSPKCYWLVNRKRLAVMHLDSARWWQKKDRIWCVDQMFDAAHLLAIRNGAIALSGIPFDPNAPPALNAHTWAAARAHRVSCWLEIYGPARLIFGYSGQRQMAWDRMRDVSNWTLHSLTVDPPAKFLFWTPPTGLQQLANVEVEANVL